MELGVRSAAADLELLTEKGCMHPCMPHKAVTAMALLKRMVSHTGEILFKDAKALRGRDVFFFHEFCSQRSLPPETP